MVVFNECSLIQLNTCDLLREKGPTAVKRCFKMQLTAFSLRCYVTSLLLQVSCS